MMARNPYDQVNRLTQKIPDASLGQPTISFTYTPTGPRASMTDASGTTNYTSYDNRDRLKTKATPEGTLNYTYDAHGNLLTIVSSNTNGASMTYTYDVLNRLATATDNGIAAQGGPGNLRLARANLLKREQLRACNKTPIGSRRVARSHTPVVADDGVKRKLLGPLGLCARMAAGWRGR